MSAKKQKTSVNCRNLRQLELSLQKVQEELILKENAERIGLQQHEKKTKNVRKKLEIDKKRKPGTRVNKSA